jgi:hypothetical protein
MPLDDLASDNSRQQPDARLRKLDPLVGAWDLRHRDLSTGEEWAGHDVFNWLTGGHFLAMHHEEFGRGIEGLMVIGYPKGWDQKTPSDRLIGAWFESSSGNQFSYVWEVDQRTVKYCLLPETADAAFEGKFGDDQNTITGAWRWPGGGYELTMTRVSEPKSNP